jgi:sugar transferase EpsL
MAFFPSGIPPEKRLLDILLATIILALISPLLIVVLILVALDMGWPVIFSQVRPGYHGIPFKIYKFRTMTETQDAQGNYLPDAERLTRLGKLLRSLSLDELPELFNVLRGEMSLVGPRPLLTQYMERYTPEQIRRHDVLPGITGWAQVNGRNILSWEDKFRLDVWYVDHWSPVLDFRILLMTVWMVMTRKGISQPGQATMEEFMGNPNPPNEGDIN